MDGLSLAEEKEADEEDAEEEEVEPIEPLNEVAGPGHNEEEAWLSGLKPNTKESYKTALKMLQEFHEEKGTMMSLPLTEVLEFMTWLKNKQRKYSTINTYLSRLNHWHTYHRYATLRTEEVNNVLEKWKREEIEKTLYQEMAERLYQERAERQYQDRRNEERQFQEKAERLYQERAERQYQDRRNEERQYQEMDESLYQDRRNEERQYQERAERLYQERRNEERQYQEQRDSKRRDQEGL